MQLIFVSTILGCQSNESVYFSITILETLTPSGDRILKFFKQCHQNPLPQSIWHKTYDQPLTKHFFVEGEALWPIVDRKHNHGIIRLKL